MSVSLITPLPTPPSRQDPANFSSRADAFLGALPTFAAEANALATEANNDATAANNAAATATTQAGIATTQAGIATTQAGIATTQANNAAASALEAALLTEKYQGSLASDPVLDKTGQPLTSGDWYVNNFTGLLRVFNGTSWVQGISTVAGVSSLNGLSGDLTGFTTNTGSQTLTNKTLSGVILNDGYTEEVFTLTGTAPALDEANGSIQTWTLTANSSPTDALVSGQSLILGITAGSFTVTWPSVTWVRIGGGGTAPTLTSSGVNWIVLWKVGSTLRGSFLGTA